MEYTIRSDCRAAQGLPAAAPESARLVLCALAKSGPMTMKDLQRTSGLARRTVYGAVRRLQEMGLVARRPSLQDTRQSWFWFMGG